VSTYHPLLETLSICIAELDVLVSFATISANYNYAMPQIVS
jgi:DNA mismatch repair ATPase MutS